MSTPIVLRPCECRGHGRDEDCGGMTVARWYFPPQYVHEGEPDYLDLCRACLEDCWAKHLTPRRLVWAEGAG